MSLDAEAAELASLAPSGRNVRAAAARDMSRREGKDGVQRRRGTDYIVSDDTILLPFQNNFRVIDGHVRTAIVRSRQTDSEWNASIRFGCHPVHVHPCRRIGPVSLSSSLHPHRQLVCAHPLYTLLFSSGCTTPFYFYFLYIRYLNFTKPAIKFNQPTNQNQSIHASLQSTRGTQQVRCKAGADEGAAGAFAEPT